MPGITEEWKLNLGESKVKYEMKIFSFVHKMRTWRTGRPVFSQKFYIGESKLLLRIFPNGEVKENRGYVSVFLVNLNRWDVKVGFEIDLGGKTMGDEDTVDIINGDESRGWGEFHSHEEMTNLSEDGDVVVTALIKLWGEEVVASSSSAKEEVIELKSELMDLKRKFDVLETTVVSKNETMENPNKKKASLPCPECPICFNEMKPPTRIAQCSTGHLICHECRDRPEIINCPTCKMDFTGRAIGMEKYLNTIFSVTS